MVEESKRYITKHAVRALWLCNEKNKISDNQYKWKVAIRVKDRIVFDIDDNNLENIITIMKFYEPIFGKFNVVKTYKGYHLITVMKYENALGWEYDSCRVLYPNLEMRRLEEYQAAIRTWYYQQSEHQRKEQLDRQKFLNYLPQQFKKSGLYKGIGTFDMLFAINVVLKGYYCIRITKKGIDDKPQTITI